MERMILFVMGWIILGLTVLNAWIRERRKKRRILWQCHAVIHSKRTENRTIDGSRSILWYYVTFRLMDGCLVVLGAPEEIGRLPKGTEGTLIYHGRACESFRPDGEI